MQLAFNKLTMEVGLVLTLKVTVVSKEENHGHSDLMENEL